MSTFETLKASFLDLPVPESYLPDDMLADLQGRARALAGILRPISDEVRIERGLQGEVPRPNLELQKGLSSDPAIVARVRDFLIRKIWLDPETREPVDEVLSFLLNYTAYINLEGLLQVKETLLRKHTAGPLPTRNERMAVTAEHVLGILSAMQRLRAPDSRAFRGYAEATRVMEAFLEQTGVRADFDRMGFSSHLGEHHMRLQAEPPQIGKLTPLEAEYIFITIHQVFEVFFDEMIRSLRAVTRSSWSAGQRLQIPPFLNDVATLLDTANQFFPVLQLLMTRKEFDVIRNSLGTASGAQSPTYALIQHLIGFPPEGPITIVQRRMIIDDLIGEQGSRVLARQVKSVIPVRDLCAPPQHEPVLQSCRRLDIALLGFKAGHGRMMTSFVDPTKRGTRGTTPGEHFRDGMYHVFPILASAQEKYDLAIAADRGIAETGGDNFRSVVAFIDSLPREISPELLPSLTAQH